MFTLNKTHKMILVCAADDFRKISFFKKYHSKSVQGKNSSVVFFKLARCVCNHLFFNLIKTALKPLIFFIKLTFAFFNLKIMKK